MFILQQLYTHYLRCWVVKWSITSRLIRVVLVERIFLVLGAQQFHHYISIFTEDTNDLRH